MSAYWPSLLGGALIGVAASMMLLIGRVTGISGIVGELFFRWQRRDLWRLAFVGGLATGAVALAATSPAMIPDRTASPTVLVCAGLLVGFGTRLANGCTSGHGVCGIPKLSPRSLASTAVFMATGVAVATLLGGR